MTAVEVVVSLLGVGLASGAFGVWWGRRLANEETRMRGEHALRVLDGLRTRDPWLVLYPSAARLLARATLNPDPFTRKKARP